MNILVFPFLENEFAAINVESAVNSYGVGGTVTAAIQNLLEVEERPPTNVMTCFPWNVKQEYSRGIRLSRENLPTFVEEIRYNDITPLALRELGLTRDDISVMKEILYDNEDAYEKFGRILEYIDYRPNTPLLVHCIIKVPTDATPEQVDRQTDELIDRVEAASLWMCGNSYDFLLGKADGVSITEEDRQTIIELFPDYKISLLSPDPEEEFGEKYPPNENCSCC